MVQPSASRGFDPQPDGVRDPAIFFTWAALCLLLFLLSWYVARGHKDVSGFIMVPIIAAFLAYDNVTLAIDALNGRLVSAYPPDLLLAGGGSAAADDSEGVVVVGLQRLRGAVQAFIIPLLLVCEFELNYEVHKRRSANFLFGLIAFDQGHRTTTGLLGALVRYSVWLIALAVLLIQIVVNAPSMSDPAGHMAGYTRFTAYGARAIVNTEGGAIGWGDAVDFFPMAVLLVFSSYTGASLWRYGTTISTDVRATAINPWASLLLATVGLTLAWALSPLTWSLPYATSALFIVLLGSLVVTQACVEGNVRTLEEWEVILAAANDEVSSRSGNIKKR